MPKLTRRIGIVVISRPPVTRWGTRGFTPCAVLPDVPAASPGTRLTASETGVETWYAGDYALTLHSGETTHYRNNLLGKPSVWVAMRPDEVSAITVVSADPYEGEGLATDPGLVVEALAMPADLQAWLRGFIEMYHVEHEFKKRKRKPADPESLVRGGKRILDKDETLP